MFCLELDSFIFFFSNMLNSASVDKDTSSLPIGINDLSDEDLSDEVSESSIGVDFSCFSKSSRSLCSLMAVRAFIKYTTEQPVKQHHKNPTPMPTNYKKKGFVTAT
jgi:hypothetical protein